MLFYGLGKQIIYLLPALLIALSFHEASHALVAYWLGDPTAKKMGRLSLNPMAHLEPVGALMILIVGLGWGKPVRIDAENLKPGPKLGMALVAGAGPLSNFLLAFVIGLPLRLHLLSSTAEDIRIPLDFLPQGYHALYVGIGPLLAQIALLSLALGVFNLIPLNPLDGSRLWEIILPNRLYFLVARFELLGLGLVLALILSDRFLGTNILGRVLLPPVGFLWKLLIGTPFQL